MQTCTTRKKSISLCLKKTNVLGTDYIRANSASNNPELVLLFSHTKLETTIKMQINQCFQQTVIQSKEYDIPHSHRESGP